MKSNRIKPAIALVAMTLGLAVSQAQTTSTASTAGAGGQPPPELSATEQWIKDTKQPTSWLSWGADLRLRNEYQNNNTTLTDQAPFHEADAFRFRGRVWTAISPMKDLTFNVRLAAEPRDFMDPVNSATYQGKGMEWRYGILDTLNVQWRNILDQPVTLTVGRQDIFLGEKNNLAGNYWLVGDGTPRDGSWTYFLDAARLTFDIEDIKTKVDAIYIYQKPVPGQSIPTLGNSDGYYLTEQTEQGAILYVSNKSIEKTEIAGYFMYKGDKALDPAGDPLHRPTGGDTGDIFTLGAKVLGNFADNWRYYVEGAYQWGHKAFPYRNVPSQSLSAYGLNSSLSYLFKDKLDNQLRLDFEYLSGDNPSTLGENEGFDILWGRYPRWTEVYVSSFNREPAAHNRPGQMQNLVRFGPAWSITPIKDLMFCAEYNALFAPEGIDPSTLFAGGDFRGHFLQAVLQYKFSRHMTGHLWAEFVFPGNFYTDTSDMFTFLRAQVMFAF